MFLALLCGSTRGEATHSSVLGHFEARVGVSPEVIVEGVELLPLQLPLVLERVRVVTEFVE